MRARLAEMVEDNDLGLWTRDVPSTEQPIDPAELATALRVPTMVVVGSADLPGFVAVGAWLAANVPGATSAAVLVEGSGHMLPMEAPGAFNAILGRFLAEQTTPPGATVG